MRVLYATAEAFPFAGTGGLGEVGRYLPQALRKLGLKVELVLPFYQRVKKSGLPFYHFAEFELQMGKRRIFTRILYTYYQSLRVFFIDQPELFDRPFLYGPPGEAFPDNALRFASFSKALVKLLEEESYQVVHLNDWHTALLPLFLNGKTPPILFTIHNMGYQGDFPQEVLKELGIPPEKEPIILHHGRVNFLKVGILLSDLISTVSPTYAQEIQTPEYGFGLEDYLRERSDKLVGILNGVDYSIWDPRNDPFIPCRFSPGDLSGKSICKRELLKEMGFPEEISERPLLSMVSRLVYQKGLDLLIPLLPFLQKKGYPLVILGTGEKKYEEALRDHMKENPLLKLIIGYDEALAHRIIAGADLLLIPSFYEPCGLNQMYGMRYGTLPVVRDTGGLKDTVKDVNLKEKRGTGFKFRLKKPCYFLRALLRGIKAYEDKTLWSALQKEAMEEDFSWEKSAKEYLKLYQTLLTPGDKTSQ